MNFASWTILITVIALTIFITVRMVRTRNKRKDCRPCGGCDLYEICNKNKKSGR